MASNNDSRKRRRVTFEDDTEVPSKRGRVDGRDTEKNRGPLSGRMLEELGHGLRERDAPSSRVGEGMGDDSRASRREYTGPVGPSWRLLAATDRTQRGTQDRSERAHVRDAGRTLAGDGRQDEHRGARASAAQALAPGPMTLNFANVLSFLRRYAVGETALNTDGGEGNAPLADQGPYLDLPVGSMTAYAVVALVNAFGTGTRSRDTILDAFVSLNMSAEMAMSHSPTREVFSISTPIMREPMALTCDVCHHDGTHITGHCAMVTSDKHGDTNTDPFCSCSSSRAMDRSGKPTHGLQRSRDSSDETAEILCEKLAAHWEKGELGVLFEKFVVERRRMAPLLVYSEEFCFVRLAIDYSNVFCKGKMPEAMEGIWPYTKADAIRHKDQLRRFYEIGMENMPKGELESLNMAQIRARYDTVGGIPPQYRHQT